jgi:uncharacterized cupin superfamily protein
MPTPAELRERLIRNLHDVPRERFQRAPLYDSEAASLTKGTAARQLGASVDTVAPGHMSCPYHLHHAEEEMFIILQGEGTLRVAGERVPVRADDVITIPPGPEYPDSGKVGVFGDGLRLLQRRDASLDYWDGEP